MQSPTAVENQSPLITVVFPSASNYDRDGDGLLELEVALEDSLSGIDPTSISVTSDRPAFGTSTNDNLIGFWTVVRADSTGFLLEEALDHLLPRGQVRLEVSVRDRRGNRTEEAVTLPVLSPAALHKIIDLEAQHWNFTSQVAVGPDGRFAYVTTEELGGSALSIVDLESLTLVKVVRSPIPALSRMALDVARGRLYLASIDEPRVGVFDLASETFLTSIETSARGIGIAFSKTRREAYVALEVEGPTNGFISVIDVDLGLERTVIDLGVSNTSNPGDALNIHTLTLDPMEARLYAPTSESTAQQGLLVIDPLSGELLQQIDLWPEKFPFLGGAADVDLDGNRLIAAQESQEGVGRVIVMPIDGQGSHRFSAVGVFLVPKELVISPNRHEWAIISGDGGAGFRTVQLMDAATLVVSWEHRIPRSAVTPSGLAFRPDGILFFVGGGREDRLSSPSPNELSVFLRRPH